MLHFIGKSDKWLASIWIATLSWNIGNRILDNSIGFGPTTFVKTKLPF